MTTTEYVGARKDKIIEFIKTHEVRTDGYALRVAKGGNVELVKPGGKIEHIKVKSSARYSHTSCYFIYEYDKAVKDFMSSVGLAISGFRKDKFAKIPDAPEPSATAAGFGKRNPDPRHHQNIVPPRNLDQPETPENLTKKYSETRGQTVRSIKAQLNSRYGHGY